ncbi:MAG: restriction endonuclease, partial [Limisphaerales bacterium]
RPRAQQLPTSRADEELLRTLVHYFKEHEQGEHAFEACAVAIARLLDAHIIDWQMTRFSVDGGRDATGRYRVGDEHSRVDVEFALEAKCKGPSFGSGVKETSRLISRLRHRQFGIFVTTSYIGDQAYREIMEDGHPVMIITGADICRILARAGYNTPSKLKDWLSERF